jgi:hypothetical protein
MPLAGFESKIPARERPQTHALDRADIRIGIKTKYCLHLHYSQARNFSDDLAKGFIEFSRNESFRLYTKIVF